MQEPATNQENEPADSASASWPEMPWLPCQVSFGLPISGFTVGDFLRLEIQSVLDTRWQEGSDVEVYVNGQPIGRAEVEVVGYCLGFRIRDFL